MHACDMYSVLKVHTGVAIGSTCSLCTSEPQSSVFAHTAQGARHMHLS